MHACVHVCRPVNGIFRVLPVRYHETIPSIQCVWSGVYLVPANSGINIRKGLDQNVTLQHHHSANSTPVIYHCVANPVTSCGQNRYHSIVHQHGITNLAVPLLGMAVVGLSYRGDVFVGSPCVCRRAWRHYEHELSHSEPAGRLATTFNRIGRRVFTPIRRLLRATYGGD